jgi:chromosome segregation ATPase
MSHPTTETITDQVSAETVKALRAAMERLLAGRPARTDGRLVKENLYREAGVSRATMNRAHRILAEWDRRTAATDARTPGEARRDDELRELRVEVRTLKRERTQLQGRLDASATVIAALHHDNAALREELNGPGAVVTLNDHRAARTDTIGPC